MKNPRYISSKSSFHKDFSDTFTKLTARRSRHTVWSDFITMSACSISNACDMRFSKEREELYLTIVKRYTREEMDMFATLISLLAYSHLLYCM